MGADQPPDALLGQTTDAGSTPPTSPGPDGKRGRGRKPLYARLLRLRHIRPNGWQRAVLGEGTLALAVVLVLADVVSAWTLLVLPLAVAAVVKAHDVLAGLLDRRPADDDGAGPLAGDRRRQGVEEV